MVYTISAIKIPPNSDRATVLFLYRKLERYLADNGLVDSTSLVSRANIIDTIHGYSKTIILNHNFCNDNKIRYGDYHISKWGKFTFIDTITKIKYNKEIK